MNDLGALLASWRLPDGDDLLERIEQMVRPALWDGTFGDSATVAVCGVQYHLGGAQDTSELAALVRAQAHHQVLDVCWFLGGPAVQLASTIGCTVTGIDRSEPCIAAAQRIGELAGLGDRLRYLVADAVDLPFAPASFDIVWNQCSLEHDPRWLQAFDRVLKPGGRLALTLQLAGRQPNPDDPFGRWSMEQVCALVAGMGYAIEHAQDISQRDSEIGWRALSRRLRAEEPAFEAHFGLEWVRRALDEFDGEVAAMQRGDWGNGRLVAQKRAR